MDYVLELPDHPDGDIPSDKGNKFTVSSIESYTRQGDLHTRGDRMVTEKEVERLQTRMNVLSRGLAKITGVGINWGEKNQGRCWGNLISEACIAPLLYPSPKTHKPLDQLGDPKSRPIVQASSCITSRPGEILADILQAALLSFPNQQECLSTEEMLAKVDLANEVIRSKGVDVCVGSGDVVGLYPSLQHAHSSKLCGELIVACPATFKNVDYNMAAIFVATNCDKDEIKAAGLSKVVPARRHARGHAPTASTPELWSNPNGVAQPSKFLPVKPNMTVKEERCLLAKVVEVGVRKVMRNHVYQWGGNYWLQAQGVATGLRLSGIVGRISMDYWRGEVARLMQENGMTTYLLEKYVDDSEVLCENMDLGTRWVEGRLVLDEQAAKLDHEAGRRKDDVTMTAWGEMASSIVPGLQFTVDYSSNNTSGTVPMLDFQLWREEEPDPNNIGSTRQSLRYSFYEKSMASKRVIDKESAMPHNMKMATLTQEGVRRLCNSSRELATGIKCDILSTYMQKLRMSGYSQKIRMDVLKAAVTTFRRKIRAEQLGIQPVHRLQGFNAKARRTAKVTEKQDWFKSRNNHWKRHLQRKEEEMSNGQKSMTNVSMMDSCSSSTSTAESRGNGVMAPMRTSSRTDSCSSSTSTAESREQVPMAETSAPTHTHIVTPPAGPSGDVSRTGSCMSSTSTAEPRGTKPGPSRRGGRQGPTSRTEGVLFVPHTPGGGLQKLIQRAEDNFAALHKIPRVKVIERGGSKLQDLMWKKDPWSRTTCGKADCLICCSKSKKEGTAMACRVESVCYVLSCDRCLEGGVKAEYYGESARTGYLRGQEHAQGPYSMSILRRHKTPLARQMHEATEIECSKAGIIMNSKGEFNGSRVPRVVIEVGARTLTTDYDGSQPGQWQQGVQHQQGLRGRAQPGEGGPEVVPVPLGEEEERLDRIRRWEAGVRRSSTVETSRRQDKRRDSVVQGPRAKRPRGQPSEDAPGAGSIPMNVTDTGGPRIEEGTGSGRKEGKVLYGATDIRYRSMDQVLMAGARKAAVLTGRTQVKKKKVHPCTPVPNHSNYGCEGDLKQHLNHTRDQSGKDLSPSGTESVGWTRQGPNTSSGCQGTQDQATDNCSSVDRF